MINIPRANITLPSDVMGRIALTQEQEEKAKQAQVGTQIAQQLGLPSARAKLSGMQLANLINTIKAKYLPQQEQSAIALREAQTQLAPLTAAINAAKLAQSQSRFGSAYQMNRTLMAMPKAQRDQWIAQNTAAYQQMIEDLGNKQLQQAASVPTQIVNKLMQKILASNPNTRSAVAQATNMPSEDVTSATPEANAPAHPLMPNVQNVQQPALPVSGQAEQQSFGTTPEQRDANADLAKYETNRALLTTQQKTRLESSIDMEQWLTKNRPWHAKMINLAIQYAGAAGRGKREEEEWLNKNPDGIAAYDWYTTQFVPNLVNQVKMMEKMGATDAQRIELNGMIGRINNVRSNPVRAKMAINNAIRTLQNISEAIINASEPANKGITRKLYGLQKIEGNYTNFGTVRVQMGDGSQWDIPVNNLNKALKRGAKQL